MITWFFGLFRPVAPPDCCRYCITELELCGSHAAEPALCQNCSYGLVCPHHGRWWLAP